MEKKLILPLLYGFIAAYVTVEAYNAGKLESKLANTKSENLPVDEVNGEPESGPQSDDEKAED